MTLDSEQVPKDKINSVITFFKTKAGINVLSPTNKYEVFRAKYKGCILIVYTSGRLSFADQPLMHKMIEELFKKEGLVRRNQNSKTTNDTDKKQKIRLKPKTINIGKVNVDNFKSFILEKGANELNTTDIYMHSRFILKDTKFTLYKSGSLVFLPTEENEKIVMEFLSLVDDDASKIIIGQDETGKGEWYGPMTIVSVALTKMQSKQLQVAGVKDSKKLKTKGIKKLYEEIISNSLAHKLIEIYPKSFNKRYSESQASSNTLNDLLAWGHRRALEGVLREFKIKKSSFKDARLVIDQFDRFKTDKELKRVVGSEELKIEQKTKAEEKVTAVAAASILAKYYRNEKVKELQNEHNIDFKIKNPTQFLLHPKRSELVKVSYLETMLSNSRKKLSEICGLIIGINDYDKKIGLKSLKYASKDAKSFYEFLLSLPNHNHQNLRLLTDGLDKNQDISSLLDRQKYTEPTRSNIIEQLDIMSNLVDEEDTFIFYFAGHGIREDKIDRFLPSDVVMTSLDDTAISSKSLIKRIENIPSRNKILIFDACREQEYRKRSTTIRNKFGIDVLETTKHKKMFTLLSCKPDQSSYEIDNIEHGIFTYSLLKGLNNSAIDESGRITVRSLCKYVEKEVPKLAEEINKMQNPEIRYEIQSMSEKFPDIFLLWPKH